MVEDRKIVSSGYDERHIQTLSELDHIRQNHGMYIGSNEVPNHLLYEVLDNSLDEANAKYASLVGVFINSKEGTCTVSDNGRGIPFTGNVIETIATKLFSGGKFKKGQDGSAYGIAAGLHGIGLVAVTALSDWIEFIIYRDNKKAIYRFEDAKLKKKEVIDFPSDKRPFSTQVSFKAAKKYFESLVYDVDPIRERLMLASVGIPHLKLILVVDDKKEIINCDINQYFSNYIMQGETKNITPILSISNKIKDEEIVIKFAWDMNSGSAVRNFGSVNLLGVNQGTHINRTLILFRDLFTQYAKKEKLTFQPNDCLVGFRALTMLSLYTPEYSSQTKEKLSTNKAKLDHLYNNLEKQIEDIFEKNPELKMQLLGFFESYRKGLSASKNIVKGTKDVSRFNQVIDSKLKDCSTHTVEHSELIICEGSSAAGGLVQCRDPKYHAILGLKGKIPNMAGGKKDFLKNKEITEICNALGTGIFADFDKTCMRYGKILFAADGDADGCVHHERTFIYVISSDKKRTNIKSIGEVISNKEKYQDSFTIGFDEDIKKYVVTPILKIWPLKKFKSWVKIELEDNSYIEVSSDHLYLTTRGWIRADELKETDEILNAKDSEIKSII